MVQRTGHQFEVRLRWGGALLSTAEPDDDSGRQFVSVDHLLGGYYSLYRRFFFLFSVVIVFLLVRSLGAPIWVSTTIAGFSIGPILLLEQWFANRALKQD